MKSPRDKFFEVDKRNLEIGLYIIPLLLFFLTSHFITISCVEPPLCSEDESIFKVPSLYIGATCYEQCLTIPEYILGYALMIVLYSIAPLIIFFYLVNQLNDRGQTTFIKILAYTGFIVIYSIAILVPLYLHI